MTVWVVQRCAEANQEFFISSLYLYVGGWLHVYRTTVPHSTTVQKLWPLASYMKLENPIVREVIIIELTMLNQYNTPIAQTLVIYTRLIVLSVK